MHTYLNLKVHYVVENQLTTNNKKCVLFTREIFAFQKKRRQLRSTTHPKNVRRSRFLEIYIGERIGQK